MRTSVLSQNLGGSEILNLNTKVNELTQKGHKIFNLTIGDFDSKIFPIPELLKNTVINAYQLGHTNYPSAPGEPSLRKTISSFLIQSGGPEFSENEILVASGARPLIYAFYKTILDPGDTVLFPVPSWNNDAYSYLNRSCTVLVPTHPQNNFMPTARELSPQLSKASLLVLCSPLNPGGTVFETAQLEEICDLILAENRQRLSEKKKPLYLLYDSIYWQLTFGGKKFVHPVLIRPEMTDFMISIDGISKAYAATGLRVGWAYGPEDVVRKMAALLTHIGAWAPKPEQIGTAEFLSQFDEVQKFLDHHKSKVLKRLSAFYHAFKQLKSEGFQVDAIQPEGALYLSVNLELKNKITALGKKLDSARAVADWLLEEVSVALVPFYAFGTDEDLFWFRLSVGRVNTEEIPFIIESLRNGLSQLK